MKISNYNSIRSVSFLNALNSFSDPHPFVNRSPRRANQLGKKMFHPHTPPDTSMQYGKSLGPRCKAKLSMRCCSTHVIQGQKVITCFTSTALACEQREQRTNSLVGDDNGVSTKLHKQLPGKYLQPANNKFPTHHPMSTVIIICCHGGVEGTILQANKCIVGYYKISELMKN